MAKSSSFFGLRTGSTKSHTYQIYRGQQITKDRVTRVSNPQTKAQMVQRLSLVCVSNAASRLNGLINHSFEGVEYGYKSIAEFKKRALSKKAGLQMTSYCPKDFGDAGIMAWPFSAGTLRPIPYTMSNQGNNDNLLFRASTPAEKYSWDTIGTLSGAEVASNQAVIKSLLSTFNLDPEKVGQLTMVRQQVYSNDSVVYKTGENTQRNAYRTFFSVARLVLDPTGEIQEVGDWTITTTDSEIVLESAELNQKITIQKGAGRESGYPDNWAFLTEGGLNAYPVVGSALILSQKDNTTWRRSSSNMAVNTSASFQSYWNLYSEVIYGYSKTDTTSTKYLNSGSQSTGITNA